MPLTPPTPRCRPPTATPSQETEKLYVELKNILARQPGPEVAEQVALYQGSLRDKTKQLKAMASELNMCQAQVRGCLGVRGSSSGGSGAGCEGWAGADQCCPTTRWAASPH